MMARLQFTELEQLLPTQPFVTISEPACGAGGMMIAAAVEMQALGYPPPKHMWVSCVDIDVVAMSMAYIQLSSLGIPGEVVLGNALADERRLVMYTRCIGWKNGHFAYKIRKQLIDYNRPEWGDLFFIRINFGLYFMSLNPLPALTLWLFNVIQSHWLG